MFLQISKYFTYIKRDLKFYQVNEFLIKRAILFLSKANCMKLKLTRYFWIGVQCLTLLVYTLAHLNNFRHKKNHRKENSFWNLSNN